MNQHQEKAKLQILAAALSLAGLLTLSAGGNAAELPSNVDAERLARTSSALQLMAKASNADEALLALEQSLPNLGGFYFDETGSARVLLTAGATTAEMEDAAAIGDALASLRKTGRRGIAAERKPAAIETARFKFSELIKMRSSARDLLSLAGAQSLDADEKHNRVSIVVTSAEAAKQIREKWVGMGHPGEALEVRVEPLIEPARALFDEVRPVPGGYMISFGYNTCTLGYSVRHNGRGGEMGFITNSHCTNVQGGVEGTEFTQPASGLFDPNDIGIERLDPRWVTTFVNCPVGRVCRRSDSAYASFNKSSWARLGRIAEPAGYCALPTIYCTLTVSSSHPEIVMGGKAGIPMVGQYFEKVGQTTGWTYGQVVQTCVDVNVGGGNTTLLCEDAVDAGVDSGDSGSPVFTWNGETHLVGGLLWGSQGRTRFWFSYVDDITVDLGWLDFF